MAGRKRTPKDTASGGEAISWDSYLNGATPAVLSQADIDRRYEVAFALATSSLDLLPSDIRLRIADIFHALSLAVRPLDEDVAQRGIAFVVAVLEHGLRER